MAERLKKIRVNDKSTSCTVYNRARIDGIVNDLKKGKTQVLCTTEGNAMIHFTLLISYLSSSIYPKRTSRYASASSLNESFHIYDIKNQPTDQSLLNNNKCPNWCVIGNNYKSKMKCSSRACKYTNVVILVKR